MHKILTENEIRNIARKSEEINMTYSKRSIETYLNVCNVIFGGDLFTSLGIAF